jgi:beta-glucosidase
MPNIYEFPKDFLWGTATSAFQVEGNNDKTDWWYWENDITQKSRYPLEKSDIACDSYNRYEEDFDLCAKMNNNAIRMSIEWARIEPEEGQIDIGQVEHYRKVLKAAKARGLKTYVTLFHFTSPMWLAKKGGWSKLGTIKLYADYAKVCAEQFGDLVDAFITINEPLVYTTMSHINGIWPPSKSDLLQAIIVENNLTLGHIAAYKSIKKITNKPVGLVENVCYFMPAKGRLNWLSRLVCWLLTFCNVDLHLSRIKNYSDFIGLNYYFTTRISGLKTQNLDDLQSDLSWWIYPEGLAKVLLHLKHYNLPIYITENGLADAKDDKRTDFIKQMLIQCNKAMQQGVNVKGYFHWSLLDNYEWHQGFWPRFGLVDIDRSQNLKRIPRPSFYYYADICKDGRILE